MIINWQKFQTHLLPCDYHAMQTKVYIAYANWVSTLQLKYLPQKCYNGTKTQANTTTFTFIRCNYCDNIPMTIWTFNKHWLSFIENSFWCWFCKHKKCKKYMIAMFLQFTLLKNYDMPVTIMNLTCHQHSLFEI